MSRQRNCSRRKPHILVPGRVNLVSAIEIDEFSKSVPPNSFKKCPQKCPESSKNLPLENAPKKIPGKCPKRCPRKHPLKVFK